MPAMGRKQKPVALRKLPILGLALDPETRRAAANSLSPDSSGALNSCSIDANVINSVVHTGVKSAGCEKKITHLPL